MSFSPLSYDYISFLFRIYLFFLSPNGQRTLGDLLIVENILYSTSWFINGFIMKDVGDFNLGPRMD